MTLGTICDVICAGIAVGFGSTLLSLLFAHAILEVVIRAEAGRDGSAGVAHRGFASLADAGLRADIGLLTVRYAAGIGTARLAIGMDRMFVDDGRWIVSHAALGPPTRPRLSIVGVDGIVDCSRDGGNGNSEKEH